MRSIRKRERLDLPAASRATRKRGSAGSSHPSHLAACALSSLWLPAPSPAAFVIGTASCAEFFEQGGEHLPAGLIEEYLPALAELERDLGKKFGDPANPLLVSVRSGAPASMPGMMGEPDSYFFLRRLWSPLTHSLTSLVAPVSLCRHPAELGHE